MTIRRRISWDFMWPPSRKALSKSARFGAVNLDPRESELASESLGSLKNIFATVVSGENSSARAAAAQLSDEQKRLAPEWRWCLLAAMCCLVLEVALRDFWKSS